MKSILLLSIFLSTVAAMAQPVIQCPQQDRPLAERWQWAVKEAAGQKKPYWIGYSVTRLMEKNSFIGTISSDPRSNKPTLCEALGFKDCPAEELPHRSQRVIESGGITTFDSEIPGEKVMKQIGVLFNMSGAGTQDASAIEDIKASNFSLRVDLEEQPVYWLGETDETQSGRLFIAFWPKLERERIKKQVVGGVGMHVQNDETVKFLVGVLNSGEGNEIRKDAAFWLGQTNTPEALTALTAAAKNDRSSGVREGAVFGISQMERDDAVETLIALAQSDGDTETRKHALFWLGQKASDKAAAAIGDIAEDDTDTEVQKSAVFALTQLPDDRGIEPLIAIAKTHKNRQVRKSAIFWLGQAENARARETLIEMIKE